MDILLFYFMYCCYKHEYFVLYISGVIDTNDSLKLEALKGVKKALVSKENIADDTLGDEEWTAISSSK